MEGERIARVGLAGDFSPEAGTEVVDCRGKTVMPGMINCHVHVVDEPYTWDWVRDEQETRLALRGARHLEMLLKSGVTFVRDLGADRGVSLHLKKPWRTG